MSATAAAGVFLAVLVGLAVLWPGEETAYRPGGEVEGLSNSLGRALPDDAPALRFRSVGQEAGLDFRHFPLGRTAQLPEDMGSGAAWGDVDGDDYPDLYLVNMAANLASVSGATGVNPLPGFSETENESETESGNRLFRNRRDGTFEDVTEQAGLELRHMGSGAAFADCDADGDRDLIVTGYGANALFLNLGDGTFERATFDDQTGFWTGASWADFDRDGDLDLYITGYVRYTLDLPGTSSRQYQIEQPRSLNPSSFAPERNLLYLNDGNCHFEEAASRFGVDNPEGRSLAAAWMDANQDGWLDLYVANDVSDNVLFLNEEGRRFLDVSHAAAVADYRGAMGIAVGDWNGDQTQDIFVTHWLAQENALYQAMPAPEGMLRFMDVADRVGLGQIATDFVGWGTVFADFDRDGRPDLFVANGSTLQDDAGVLISMPDQLFWNAGPDRGFFEVGEVAGDGVSGNEVGRGVATADYDRDGDVDILVVNHGESPKLLRNDTQPTGGFVGVTLSGRSLPDAIGSQVSVWAGGATQTRSVGAQASYLSQNDLGLLFGITADVDSIQVIWPDGHLVSYPDLPSNAWVELEDGGEWRVLGASPDLTDLASDKERTARFWTVYRGATRQRQSGRFEQAESLLREAVQLRPDHRDARYYQGAVLLELGRFDEARAAWQGLADSEPNSARARRQLGVLHLCYPDQELYSPETGRRVLEGALKLNSEETGVQILLAHADLVSDVPEALERLDRVRLTNPYSRAAAGLQAVALVDSGRKGDAKSVLNQAIGTTEPTLEGASAEGDNQSGELSGAGSACAWTRSMVNALALAQGPVDDQWLDIHVQPVVGLVRDLRRR